MLKRWSGYVVAVVFAAVSVVAAYRAVDYRDRYRAVVADPYHISHYEDSDTMVVGQSDPAVVLVGDSMIARWSLPQTAGGYRVINRGIGSETTDGLIGRFHGDVLSLHPRAVVILSGVNDLAIALRHDPGSLSLQVAKIESNLRLMVQAARQEAILPILCSVIPVDERWGTRYTELNASIQALNERIAALARAEGAKYLDFVAAIHGVANARQADGIHLNAEAYGLMWELVVAALTE